LKNLMDLNLDGNPLDKSVIAQIRTLLPGCEIDF